MTSPAFTAEPDTPVDRPSLADGPDRPFPLRLILTGFALLLSLFGALAAWSTLAPLEGAVVSPGIVSVAGFRKEIQHLEGGIVESILVRDGDRVEKGQLLVKMRDVKPDADLRQLDRQHVEAQAVVARLLAEQDQTDRVQFPDALLTRADEPLVRSVIRGQEQILASRRKLTSDQQLVFGNKIAQTREQIAGLSAQLEARQRQQLLLKEELADVNVALAKRLVNKAVSLKLQQRVAEGDGEVSALRAELGRLRQSMLEVQLQLSEAEARRVAEINESLRTQRALVFDLSQRIIAARDVLRRTRIVSPIDGIVVNLGVHTRDGVIAAGETIMEVVPSDDALVVYAFVNPDDIDEVRSGMAADVQLTSVNRRRRIPLEGIVSDISADRLIDPRTGAEYFRARIDLTSDVSAPSQPQVVAGMGADVFIRTGARTLLDYLLSPITKNLQFGLREK